MKTKTITNIELYFACLGLILGIFIFYIPTVNASDIRDMIFPVIGETLFSNDFGAPRSGGRTHEGIDVFGNKMQRLICPVDGYVNYVAYPEPYYGYGAFIQGDDGYEYWFLHMNNDNPGTDDGLGGGINAYAIDVYNGNPVTQGQLIGYIGDSGNAENTSPHLHFEIHRPDENIINPYESLLSAQKIAGPIFHPPLPDEILPYTKFEGGASVARGNVDSRYSGQEIIIGAGAGGGPHVKIYSANGLRLSDFFPYPTGFRGGVDVATGDVDGNGIDEIITGAGPGGGPHVRVFKRDGQRLSQFFAYDEDFRGGVRIDMANVDTNSDTPEIITAPASHGGPQITLFSSTGTLVKSYYEFEPWWRGGYDIGAGYGVLSVASGSGGRRTSVRDIIK
ncbi:M23 family metallopeptidase [Patescibacteria group bacterium]|nr:M23 family metallopeptidase [Patescibacteria group bacterium]